MGAVNEVNLDRVFTYHPVKDDQKPLYKEITESAKHLAAVVLKNCPNCADRSNALRLIREARMWANASIALDGEV